MKNKEELKREVVAEIIKSKGFKNIACASVGLNPRTFRAWMGEDDEFRTAVAEAVEIARDYRDDLAERKLFEKVEGGDTTAVIFYCKTRLKARGYSERAQVQDAQESESAAPTALQGAEDAQVGELANAIRRRITAKKTYIVKLLKQQGKYTPELSMQVKMTAQLLVRVDLLAEQIFGAGHEAVNVELSREGNKRESVNPKERLYLDFLQQGQKALRALGMNTDSKERKTDNDGFGEFMAQFND